MFNAVIAGKQLLPPDFMDKALQNVKYAFAGEVLRWTTIFAVKFSFLFYFRGLVRRLPRLTVLWWFTVAICTPVAITSICASFITCPYVGFDAIGAFYLACQLARNTMLNLYWQLIAEGNDSCERRLSFYIIQSSPIFLQMP